MASFNQVVIMGNLTRDVEVRHLQSGSAVAEVSVAVNRKWKDKNSGETKEEVGFFDVVMWGRQAEIAEQYLHKGSGLLVQGRLQQDRWEDKETGKGRSKVKIVCENFQMLSKGSGEGGGDYSQAAPAQAAAQPAWSNAAPAQGSPNPDEIPF